MNSLKTVDPKNILIVSAEASSNLYAVRILEKIKQENLGLECWGIGNASMGKLGFRSIARAEDMAVMGLVEVVKHYPFIKKIYDQILKEAELKKPSLAILMDYAEFNLKIAQDLKSIGIKVVFYISPQIWAWRQSRVKKIQNVVDEMLCIFPFEQEFYRSHGLQTEFVGHPLLDELHPELFDDSLKALKKQRMGLRENQRVLGLLPGSRKSEIAYNFPTQLELAKKVSEKYSDVAILILVAPGMEIETLKSYFGPDTPSVQFVQDEPFSMLQLLDFAVVTSGTATLVTGLMRVPMIVMYKMNPLSAFLAKRLVSKTNPFFGMINLIFGKEIMPEFFQEDAIPSKMLLGIERQWMNEDVYSATKKELSLLPDKLGNKGATSRVFEIIKRYL